MNVRELSVYATIVYGTVFLVGVGAVALAWKNWLAVDLALVDLGLCYVEAGAFAYDEHSEIGFWLEMTTIIVGGLALLVLLTGL